MIIGIGCDVINHEEITQLNWDSNETIQRRMFSENELTIYRLTKQIDFLAGRFAVKESVLKCLQTGMVDGMFLTDIEVLKSQSNNPTIQLKGYVKEIADGLGINKWHVSITHSKDSSIAFVVAEQC